LAKPGEIVLVDFPGVAGVKRRPAVVLSSDEYHATRPDIIIGLVTSQVRSANTPTDHRLLDWEEAGLRVSSSFRAFLVTLPATSVVLTVGMLSARDWEAVQSCVKVALAPLKSPTDL
jgi:mRNA interferase MazF